MGSLIEINEYLTVKTKTPTPSHPRQLRIQLLKETMHKVMSNI